MVEKITYSQQCLMRMNKLVFMMDKIIDQLLREKMSLRQSQILIMMAIKRKSDLPQKSIADFLGITQAAVSRQIELLEKSHLISRKENDKNRRANMLILTKQGEQKLKTAVKLVDSALSKHFEPLKNTGLVEQLDKVLLSIAAECFPEWSNNHKIKLGQIK